MAALLLATTMLSHSANAAWDLAYSWQEGQAFDPTFWELEAGFVRNNEKQYYEEAFGNNIRLENGLLTIEARKERKPNSRYQEGSTDWRKVQPFTEYTSASMRTKRLWDNGRFEVVARVPRGKGLWPAVWLRATNDGQYGEIDIMEYLGRKPGTLQSTFHWGKSILDSERTSRKSVTAIQKLEERFVKYAAELTPDDVRIFIDDKPVLEICRKQAAWGNLLPLTQSFRLLVNLALGDWGGVVEDKALPAQLKLQSIRIWDWRDQQ